MPCCQTALLQQQWQRQALYEQSTPVRFVQPPAAAPIRFLPPAGWRVGKGGRVQSGVQGPKKEGQPKENHHDGVCVWLRGCAASHNMPWSVVMQCSWTPAGCRRRGRVACSGWPSALLGCGCLAAGCLSVCLSVRLAGCLAGWLCTTAGCATCGRLLEL
jgi:hypothetical protein